MKIVNAKQTQNGLVLFCRDSEYFKIGSLFQFESKDKDEISSYKVEEISLTETEYAYTLTYYGYRSCISRLKGFELRDVVGFELQQITDVNTISSLQRQSRYL